MSDRVDADRHLTVRLLAQDSAVLVGDGDRDPPPVHTAPSVAAHTTAPAASTESIPHQFLIG
jgi:hypothetical protein